MLVLNAIPIYVTSKSKLISSVIKPNGIVVQYQCYNNDSDIVEDSTTLHYIHIWQFLYINNTDVKSTTYHQCKKRFLYIDDTYLNEG